MEIEINTNIDSESETLTDVKKEELLIANEVHEFEKYLMENTDDSSLTISEDETEYIIELSLPGFDPQDITMEIENNVLSIEAKTETERSEKSQNYSDKEFTYSSYSRSVKLPGNLENEKLEAEYKNGILTLTFPKVEITSLEPAQESLLL